MTVKELDKLIKLCRRRGVLELTFEGVQLKLTEAPPLAVRSASEAATGTSFSLESPEVEKAWEQLSEDERLFYSSDSVPKG